MATVRQSDIGELLKSLAIEVREFVAQAIEPITSKQAELQARIVELERAAQCEREGGS